MKYREKLYEKKKNNPKDFSIRKYKSDVYAYLQLKQKKCCVQIHVVCYFDR